MYTGYYIDNKDIFGPRGYTQSYIDDGYIYMTGKGYTQCWIENGDIFKSGIGYTKFYIDGNDIFGPSKTLPWL